MHELILVEQTTGRELGRRQIAPSERYDYYRDHMEGELLVLAGMRYTTHSLAWLIPEENLRVGASFHSYDRS